ncbi:MAG TPA: gliding motility-associated C-terminal domain-containing protein [Bacteroidia bacterium]|nr:gliding motility-associated C-terminal domain-containing protein [Bacteroidia bacterium]HRG53614.1 gliding motility-associated C-terminal domain-containing protein [Bacteroidia bacterium]
MKISKFHVIVLFAMIVAAIQAKAQGNECTSAVTLNNLTNYCSAAKQFTNLGSTPALNGLGIPTCFNTGATYDVWFSFRAIGTDVQFSVAGGGTNGSILRPNIVLYSGTCGGQLIEQVCSPGNATNVTTAYKGSLTIGTTYLIRISTTSSNRGTFKFCISNYTPTVNPGADCDGAVKLCDKSQVKVAGLSGGGKNNKEIEPNSCFYDANMPNVPPLESNSSWYKWTCSKAGTLTFDITPVDPTNDIDFILYELSGTSTDACGTRTSIRCTASSCQPVNGAVGIRVGSNDTNEPPNCNPPNTGSDGYLRYVDMTVGKTYVLMVNNFSTASGFTITFGGSGEFLGPKAHAMITSTSTTCVGEEVTYDGSTSTNYKTLLWTFTSATPGSATTVGPHKVKYSAAGTYKTYLKASDVACASGNSLDSVTVTVNPATTISDAGSAQTVCGSNATLAGNTATAGTGTWVLLSGSGTIANPNSPTSTVSNLAVGPNVFRWTINNPPCSSTTSTVTITTVGVPSTANAGSDQVICGSATANLSGNLSGNVPATGTGKWTLVSGAGAITNPNSANTSVTNLGRGNNVFRWSVANSPCSDATDDVIIKGVNTPDIDTATMVVTSAACSSNTGAITNIVVTASSGVTYQWNNISYPSADITGIPAGPYTLVVTDADGCVSTMGPVSVVNPTAPTKPVIVSGGDICKGESIKVWVQNRIPGVDYSWTGPTGGPLGIHDTIYINNADPMVDLGKYSATGSLSGCVGSTGSAFVNVYNLPVPVVTGTALICPGTTAVLSAENSTTGDTTKTLSYKWTYNGIPMVPGNTPTIDAVKEGDYKVIVKNEHGCVDSSANKNLKFFAPPLVNESLVKIDSTNCKTPTGAIKNITATGVPMLNYSWYQLPATNIFNSTDAADLKNVGPGTYYLIVKDGNNCKDTSMNYVINNFKIPAVPGVLNNRPYCEGDVIQPITANGTGNGTYTWYDSEMNIIFKGTVFTPNTTKTDTLYLEETVNGCISAMDTVIIKINPLPAGSAGLDKHIICSSPTIQLDGTGSTGSPYVYSWAPASGISSGGNTLTPLVKDGTTYTLTVTNPLTGCLVTDTVVVIKDPVPLASFTTNVIQGEAPLAVNFNNLSGGANKYLWDFNDNSTVTDKDPASHLFVNAGDYTVKLTVSDSGACPSIATVLIRVYEKLDDIIPNIFTPNEDGTNDLYTVSPMGIESIQGEIYDRWGLKLFTWNQKSDGWDGRSPSGSAAPAGTYFYVIRITPQNKEIAPYVRTGQLTLIR